VTATFEPESFESPSTLAAGLRRLQLTGSPALRRLGIAAVAAAVVAGVALRFYAPTSLWLDEALSVNIARLPLTQIPRALSHDGAPPLYYVLLHFWMLAFGRSDVAVRALSGLVSVATLPLFWLAGRRLGGVRTAWICFFLGLSSPFAINYATAARMYSLMILWSLLGWLCLERALELPTRGRLGALAAVTAAMLYTHYWALYLVFVTAALLLTKVVRDTRRGVDAERPAYRQCFGAVVLGSLAFLPWAPVFVYQTLHTGTPWTSPAGPADLLGIFGDFSGSGPWGELLMFILFALLIVGVFGRRLVVPAGAQAGTAGGVLLQLRPQPRALHLFVAVAGTLGLAVGLGALFGAAFVARYAAVVLPLFLLLVALGITVFAERPVVVSILIVVTVAGLLTGLGNNQQARTQADKVAAVLNVEAQPGDLVVYCPDQLGPAVDRLLDVRGVSELTFPRAIGPQRVDWVDYKSVISATDPARFAQLMLSRLGAGHTLWLVYKDGYPGLGGDCGYLRSWLDLLRPTGTTVIYANGSYYESENLVRYPS
jgi:hypothetical protein